MSTIGISFGNTSSSIAYCKDGKVDVIANPDGERAIPSCLSYVGADEYHGGQALAQLVRNPTNTIVNFRDFIGQPFSACDVSVCAHGATPIDLNGVVGFEIKRADGNVEKITVDEVVTRHFKNLKLAADDYIGTSTTACVVSVPTNFSGEQRTALKAAAQKAGLEIIQFVHEPSAALLAHTDSFGTHDSTFVVADFGGIRSDAAVISVRGGIYTVLAAAHDFKLGGDNLTAELIEFFAKEFQSKTQANPRKNARSLAKMRAQCEITKKTLSNVQTATISIDSLADGFDFHSTINRLRYELVTRQVFASFTAFVEAVVAKAGLDVLDIDTILLSGGVSQSPKLAANLEAIFPESVTIVAPSTETKALHPQELLARGAALQASLLESYDADEIAQSQQPVILNTPHLPKALGLAGANGEFIPVLLTETSYPIKKSIVLEAKGDVLVSVHEGEHSIKETVLEAPEPEEDESEWSDEEPEVVREKHFVLGNKIVDLGVRGVEGKLEVTFNVNKDGEFAVVARDVKSGKVVKATV